MPALMLQGTGSNVGKSILVAGLCRAARRRGWNVLPFKAQNMSNNAAVTADGGEIGRAQALQALACECAPARDMNPVLLKPEAENGCQIIVHGNAVGTISAKDYGAFKPRLLGAVLESFRRLHSQCDLVLVEGAGSPAEVNLRAGDIANMGFACAANVPVVLVADIDRGGVIAQAIGTCAVLSPEERERVSGFIINKFRGDPSLFDEGYRLIEARTGWRGFGVLPFFTQAARLPAEDSMDLRSAMVQKPDLKANPLHIACLGFSRIANFDDLDPLRLERGVSLRLIEPGTALPGETDLVILPGSKSTRADLALLRAQKWDEDLRAHVRRGGRILGICGGYQMLGTQIADPEGFEGFAGSSAGLGLLDVQTTMGRKKTLRSAVHAMHHATGSAIQGYEIHIGQSTGLDCARPFAFIGDRPEGAVSGDGRIMGTYLHGIFADDAFRSTFLSRIKERHNTEPTINYTQSVNSTLDELAAHMEEHLDIEGLLALAR